MDDALRISLGMLLGPGVVPLASFLKLLLKTSFVNSFIKVTFLESLASRMRSSRLCQGYFLIA